MAIILRLDRVMADRKISLNELAQRVGIANILRLLMANTGSIVTRRLLLEKLWDCDGNFIDDHTLTVNMTRLRGRLEEEGHSYIKTIRGMGYIWTGNSKEEVTE